MNPIPKEDRNICLQLAVEVFKADNSVGIMETATKFEEYLNPTPNPADDRIITFDVNKADIPGWVTDKLDHVHDVFNYCVKNANNVEHI